MKQGLNFDLTTDGPPMGVTPVLIGQKIVKESWLELERRSWLQDLWISLEEIRTPIRKVHSGVSAHCSLVTQSMIISSSEVPPGIEGQFIRSISDGDNDWMAFSKIKHYTNAFIVDKNNVSLSPLGVTAEETPCDRSLTVTQRCS